MESLTEQGYLLGDNGVIGPVAVADLLALVEAGLLEEVRPSVFAPTEAGRRYHRERSGEKK